MLYEIIKDHLCMNMVRPTDASIRSKSALERLWTYCNIVCFSQINWSTDYDEAFFHCYMHVLGYYRLLSIIIRVLLLLWVRLDIANEDEQTVIGRNLPGLYWGTYKTLRHCRDKTVSRLTARQSIRGHVLVLVIPPPK